MPKSQANLRIELDAVKLAIEWTAFFETELQSIAQGLAESSDLITADHYRQAAPTAVAALLKAVTSPSHESTDAERRAA